jgi:SNF2 family DNA or RNA helicase
MNESNLHDYQNFCVKHVMKNPYCGLFLEMGLGKTVTTLTAINKLIYEDLEISTVLITAPKRVAEEVWDTEIEKWEHLKHLTCTKIVGNEKQRTAALLKKTDIYLISRDNMAWLCGHFGGTMVPYDMLIVDELSSYKNSKSVRFKALKAVRPSFHRVVGLTGTPAPNGMVDLWAQIHVIDRGERLGKFISKYKDEYFTEGKRNGHIVYTYNINEEKEKAIFDKIGDIVISMKSKDYLNLPGRVMNVVNLKLSTDLLARYKDFERDQVMSFLEQEEENLLGDIPEISAVNAAALYNKLLQFASGAIYDEEKNYHTVHDVKINELKELVEEANGEPVLIAWSFRHELYRIEKALAKYKPRALKNGQDIKDWNDGKIKILTMHPASGGHGLNLQAGGRRIIWFGPTNNLEFEDQLNARLDRQGQKETVIINKLIAEGTMDEEVVKRQDGKSVTQNILMDAVKAVIDKYR